MSIYKHSYWILLILPLSIILSFCSNDSSKRTSLEKQNQFVRIDSISVFQSILDTFFIEGVDDPDVFIVVNNSTEAEYQLKVQDRPVKYISKPKGYPKGDNFDHDKLIVSFEKLQFSDSVCLVTIYCKRAGIIGDFVLEKVRGEWIIKSYNTIYT